MYILVFCNLVWVVVNRLLIAALLNSFYRVQQPIKNLKVTQYLANILPLTTCPK